MHKYKIPKYKSRYDLRENVLLEKDRISQGGKIRDIPEGASRHTVLTGESFSAIAKQYPGVSAKDVAKANPLIKANRLNAGNALEIPAGKGVKPKNEILH